MTIGFEFIRELTNISVHWSTQTGGDARQLNGRIHFAGEGRLQFGRNVRCIKISCDCPLRKRNKGKSVTASTEMNWGEAYGRWKTDVSNDESGSDQGDIAQNNHCAQPNWQKAAVCERNDQRTNQ